MFIQLCNWLTGLNKNDNVEGSLFECSLYSFAFFSINMKSEKWRFGIQTQYYSFCRHINVNAFWVFLLLTRISVRAITERYFWQTTLCDHINVKVYFESCWMCGTNIIWRKPKKTNIGTLLALTKYMKINFLCYFYCLLNIIIHEKKIVSFFSWKNVIGNGILVLWLVELKVIVCVGCFGQKQESQQIFHFAFIRLNSLFFSYSYFFNLLATSSAEQISMRKKNSFSSFFAHVIDDHIWFNLFIEYNMEMPKKKNMLIFKAFELKINIAIHCTYIERDIRMSELF